jgi:hypothetical protein
MRPDGAASAPLAPSLVLCPLSQGWSAGHAPLMPMSELASR